MHTFSEHDTDMAHRQVIFVVDGVAQVSDAHAIRKLTVRAPGSSRFRIRVWGFQHGIRFEVTRG